MMTGKSSSAEKEHVKQSKAPDQLLNQPWQWHLKSNYFILSHITNVCSYLWYFFQWWHKINVAHNGQRVKHVDSLWSKGDTWLARFVFLWALMQIFWLSDTHAENVKEYRSLSPLLRSENVFRKLTDSCERDDWRELDELNEGVII